MRAAVPIAAQGSLGREGRSRGKGATGCGTEWDGRPLPCRDHKRRLAETLRLFVRCLSPAKTIRAVQPCSSNADGGGGYIAAGHCGVSRASKSNVQTAQIEMPRRGLSTPQLASRRSDRRPAIRSDRKRHSPASAWRSARRQRGRGRKLHRRERSFPWPARTRAWLTGSSARRRPIPRAKTGDPHSRGGARYQPGRAGGASPAPRPGRAASRRRRREGQGGTLSRA